MLKKTIMLAMALAVAAALAAPTMAIAGVWKHHSNPIQENVEMGVTGQAKFQSVGLGFVQCETTSTLKAQAGQSTGTVEQFHPDQTGGKTVTEKCSAGGFLLGCQVHQAEATNLPWTVHNETQQIEITSGHIDLTMTGGFCAAKRATVTADGAAHSVTATPNDPHTVDSLTLSGQVEVHLYSQHEGGEPFRTGTATVSGTQTIAAPNGNTYSTT